MSPVRRISLCIVVAALGGCDAFEADAEIDAGAGGPGKLSFTELADGDNFGAALTFAGSTVVVGAPGTDPRDPNNPDVQGSSTGAVYVFTLTGVTLALDQTLTASDARDFDAFGSALSLSGDTLAVGAPGDETDTEDNNGNGNGNGNGAVYIFGRTGTTWTEQTKIVGEGLGDGDSFGISVSLVGDTLLVGASGDDEHGNGAGAIYLFQRSGTDWLPQP